MNRWLVKNITFPLDQRLKGFSVGKALKELEKTQWFSEEELKKYQWQKIKNLLKHAYANVPYYNKVFKENKLSPKNIDSIKDLGKIPLLTKDVFKENFEDLMAKDRKRPYIKRRSSGSTGIPKTTLVDLPAASYHKAAQLRCRKWWGLDHGSRCFVIWDHKKPIPFLAGLRETFTKNKIEISIEKINKLNTRNIYNLMKKFKPDFIFGYSSGIYSLAQDFAENKLDVPRLKIKTIINCAEMLYQNQRNFIQSVFGCPVLTEYGGTEIYVIAFQCPEGSLHLVADTIYVEFINDLGQPCKFGELGNIIITDLNNFFMPHIRYRIGDVGILKGNKCPCGRKLPVMDLCVAREGDMIKLRDGRKLHYFIISLDADFKHYNEVKQYKIIQRSYNNFLIKAVADPGLKNELKTAFEEVGKSHFNEKVNFEFEFVDSIPREPSGKLRYFVCEI